ncbi:hypothetical protein BD626DRAFT_511931 [Schizophyllum amplum]|uniref:Transmembrane protein n=1 Tax=Schizophyllum amplum TaxID=97359 RepID=A0A550C0D6_9AGAR|nr:hypothetical protein BD626DRAFT_511931 [Auriculariopsis ampla]
MISQNFTIESVCPLIHYDPADGWREGDGADDPELNKYSNGAFTLTNKSGSSASFSFNGSAVYVYGAKRSNHGIYNAEIDGVTTSYSGRDSAGQFQVPLFVADSLDDTLHTVKITNQEDLYLDIDYITWTATLEGDYSPSLTTAQDGDTMFSYTPSNAWSTSASDIPQIDRFNGGTAHGTRTADASVTLEFEGQAVRLYGGTGPQRGPYDVQFDGGKVQTFNATKRDIGGQILLFYADGLGEGSHSLQLTNKPVIDGQGLAIDYVVTYNVRNKNATDSGSGSSDDESSGSDSSSGSSPNAGAIAGGVIGALAGIAVLVALVLFILRKRQREVQAEKRKLIPQSFPAPGYPPSPAGHPYPTRPAQPQYGSPPYFSANSPAQPYYSGQQPLQPNRGFGSASSDDQQTFTSYYPPSTATSYAYNSPSAAQGHVSPGTQTYIGSSLYTAGPPYNASASQPPPPPPHDSQHSPVSHTMTNPWSNDSSSRSGVTNIGAAFYATNRSDTDSAPSPTAGVPPPVPYAANSKMVGATLPATAHESLAHVSPNELNEQRMHVPGHAQDYGPLPPDYAQVFR